MAKKSIQRTTKELRELGWRYSIEEHWNPYDNKRHDLFGFIDVLALAPGRAIGIQTGIQGHAGHKKKILACAAAIDWLKTNNAIEIWTWRKLKVTRGGKAVKWSVRIEEITLNMFSMDGLDTDSACTTG
jgi:hypothetical protein